MRYVNNPDCNNGVWGSVDAAIYKLTVPLILIQLNDK
jgi:hypothetical protein